MCSNFLKGGKLSLLGTIDQNFEINHWNILHIIKQAGTLKVDYSLVRVNKNKCQTLKNGKSNY